ncbi:carbohydrate-binding protein [Fontivita pretiosa]|uniref:carbohydrate-binding protein n=1 Tax=Fontivita pretiosa TaxID=2989684 RepID=UPI003D178E0B
MEGLERRMLLADGGLAAAYFARTNFTAAKMVRTDATIDFQWSSPPSSKLGTDGFSVRWVGQILPKVTDTYRFVVHSSGGVRLWVGNKLVVNDWSRHSLRQRSGEIRLGGGRLYNFRVDYWTDSASPQVKVEWLGDRWPQELLPASRLVPAQIDTVRPTPPQRLTATQASDTAIRVTWDPASDPSGVVAYDVYLNGSKVGTTNPGMNYYARSGLEPGQGYVFSVQAIDAAANLSAQASTSATIGQRVNQPPTAPTNLRAGNTTNTAITLSWSASSDDRGVTGYEIFRDGQSVGTTASTSFTDTGLEPETLYTYTVRAFDASNAFSPISDSLTVQTDPDPSTVKDPYAGFASAQFDAQNGVGRSGGEINNLDDGDWVRYDNLDFGPGSGAQSVSIDLALPTSNRGGRIELRIDGVNGPVVGTLVAQPTGSFNHFRAQQVNVADVSGVHDLYLVFRGRNGIGNIRNIRFSRQHLTRILAVGDSITQGSSASPTYRYYLWQRLRAAGRAIDFVGSELTGYSGEYPNLDFDQEHEGHAGWRADQIAGSVGAWVRDSGAEVVLLHVGTNDLEQGQSIDSTLNDIRNIIDAIRGVNPSAIILLAQIIPVRGKEDQVAQLNAGIASVAASKSTGSSPVVRVDQFSGFDVNADTIDGVHPNASGDQKLANRWFDALEPLI